MDGSIVFARWRQCASPCNMCFLKRTRVKISNGISIKGRNKCTLQLAAPFPLKVALSYEELNLHLIHDSLGPPESSTQTASRSAEPLLLGSLL